MNDTDTRIALFHKATARTCPDCQGTGTIEYRVETAGHMGSVGIQPCYPCQAAILAAWPGARLLADQLEHARAEIEDWQHNVAQRAFTAPDADLDTVLTSMDSRIASVVAERDRARTTAVRLEQQLAAAEEARRAWAATVQDELAKAKAARDKARSEALHLVEVNARIGAALTEARAELDHERSLSRNLASQGTAMATAIQRVRDLHREYLVFDACGHDHDWSDVEAGTAHADEDIGITCQVRYRACLACCSFEGEQTQTCIDTHTWHHWPDGYRCRTLHALAGQERVDHDRSTEARTDYESAKEQSRVEQAAIATSYKSGRISSQKADRLIQESHQRAIDACGLTRQEYEDRMMRDTADRLDEARTRALPRQVPDAD